MKLFFYPDYTATNPYQRQIYSAAPDRENFAPGTIDDAIEAAAAGDGQVVFHLHWPEPLFGGLATPHDVRIRQKDVLRKLRAFRLLGGAVVWTVHNLLPHDKDRQALQDPFQRRLSHLCDTLHVHSEAAAEELIDRYKVDRARVVVLPHGNYAGWYPPRRTRNIREEFGVSPDAVLVGAIGQIRPYKGLDRLLTAFQRVRRSSADVELLVAGRPVHPVQPGRWSSLREVVPGLHVHEGHIPDDDLASYFGACDVVALPYNAIFSSGSVLLAASFGKPVIIPELGTLKDEAAAGFAFTYEPGDVDGLTRALERSVSGDGGERERMGAAATAFAAERDWKAISRSFLDAVADGAAQRRNMRRSRGYDVVAEPDGGASDLDGAVAIVVVNHHAADLVGQVAARVPERISDRRARLVAFDNSESFEELEALQTRTEGRAFVLTANDNLGYAGGNNRAVSFALERGAHAVVIANPDVVLEADAIEQCVEYALAEPKTLVGPLILEGSGDVASAGVRVDREAGVAEHLMRGAHAAEIAGREPYDVDALHGCFLAMSAEAARALGPIPEDYFLYFEETHWCVAAPSRGVSVRVLPGASIVHKKKSHGAGLPALSYFYYYIRSSFQFFGVTGKGEKAVRERLQGEFVAPWLQRIADRHPDHRLYYKRIAELAAADGAAGVTGRVDIGERLSAYVGAGAGRGSIEVYEDGLVSGWAAPGDGAAGAPHVLMFRNGEPVGAAKAEIPREDVVAAGFPGGAGFRFSGSKILVSSGEIDVRLAEDLTPLKPAEGVAAPRGAAVDGAARAAEPPDFHGRIDGISRGVLNGWASDRNHPDIPVHVDVYVNGTLLAADVPAVRHRSDLEEAGINGGYASFQIPVPARYVGDGALNVGVRPAGGKTDISARSVRVQSDADGYRPDFTVSDYMRWAFVSDLTPIAEDYSEAPIAQFSEAVKQFFARRRDGGPMISVVMPAFNREGVVAAAIASVAAQTYRNFELIVVDDGSSDDTCGVVRAAAAQHADTPITLFESERNAGVSAARNRGLEAARGDVIAYLDSDNEWYPWALAVFAGVFRDPAVATCYGGQEIWQYFHDGHVEFRHLRMCPFNRSKIETKNYIDLNVFAHRRSLTARLGGFDETMTRLVDWDLIARYTEETPPAFVPVVMNKYYVGAAENQITATVDYVSNLSRFRSARTPENYGSLATAPAPEAPGAARPAPDAADPVYDVVVAVDPENDRSLHEWASANAGWASPETTRLYAWDAQTAALQRIDVEKLAATGEVEGAAVSDLADLPPASRGVLYSHHAVALPADWARSAEAIAREADCGAATGRLLVGPRRVSGHPADVPTDIMPKLVQSQLMGLRAGGARHGAAIGGLPTYYGWIGPEAADLFLCALMVRRDFYEAVETINDYISCGFASGSIYAPDLKAVLLDRTH